MKTSEILKQAWALIDAPEKWCKGSYRGYSRDNPNIVLRCSLGAIRSVIGIDHRIIMVADDLNEYYQKAWAILNRSCPFIADIIRFNDGHKWEEVRDVWMRAIEMAENEEIAAEIRQMAVPVEFPPVEEPVPEPEQEEVPA